MLYITKKAVFLKFFDSKSTKRHNTYLLFYGIYCQNRPAPTKTFLKIGVWGEIAE